MNASSCGFKSHSLHQNDEITFSGFVIFVHHLLTNTREIQHLIQQVFNVSQNGSFFTDLLDFVGKKRYYLTAANSIKQIFLSFNNL